MSLAFGISASFATDFHKCEILLTAKSSLVQVSRIAPHEMVTWFDEMFSGFSGSDDSKCLSPACFSPSSESGAELRRLGNLITYGLSVVDPGSDKVLAYRVSGDPRELTRRVAVVAQRASAASDRTPFYHRPGFHFSCVGCGLSLPVVLHLARKAGITLGEVGDYLAYGLYGLLIGTGIKFYADWKKQQSLFEFASALQSFVVRASTEARPSVLVVGASAKIGPEALQSINQTDLYLFSDVIGELKRRGTSLVHWDYVLRADPSSPNDQDGVIVVRIP